MNCTFPACRCEIPATCTLEKTVAIAEQPEALRLAAWLNQGAWYKMTLGDVERAGRELRRLSHHEAALAEWLEKTEWVQKTSKPGEPGKHRADVLRDRISALEAENAELRRDAARYRWLKTCGCLSYTSDTGPRPSTPDERLLWAVQNAGKRTTDLIEIRLLCHHLGPEDEPIWVDGEHFDYPANMDAAIDAALKETP